MVSQIMTFMVGITFMGDTVNYLHIIPAKEPSHPN